MLDNTIYYIITLFKKHKVVVELAYELVVKSGIKLAKKNEQQIG